MEKANLTHQIIGAAYEVHNVFGFGFLEKVYENAMIIELKERGLYVESQSPLQVYYKDRLVGDYVVDLLVENEVIVELKSVTAICPEHEVQLVNYLNATGKAFGLLINFGMSVEVKRKYKAYKTKG
jgi:GxxExxY protein